MQRAIVRLVEALQCLEEAQDTLDQEPPSRGVYLAKEDTTFASNWVREALRMLDEQKDESTKHDTEREGHLATACELQEIP